MASGSSSPRPDRLRLAGSLILAVLLFSLGWMLPALQRGFRFGLPLILPYVFGVWLFVIVLVALTPAEEG